MTPAIAIEKARGIPFSIHEYRHDNTSYSYGNEAAEKLGIENNRVFKTLFIQLDKTRHCVAIIPVSHRLSLKLIAKAAKAKKADLATQSNVERLTGYILGGVSPLG